MRSSAGSFAMTARRGGWCPVWAPTVAVGLAGRLRCASRSALARRNSLHSLRSLRSDNRRGSEVEARAARVPSALLRCSPPHKSPTPGTAHRAALLVVFDDACHGGAGKAGGECATAATLCGAEERRARGRARAARASSSDSSRLFERSERSERSEFRDGPRDRAPQGSRPAAARAPALATCVRARSQSAPPCRCWAHGSTMAPAHARR